MLTNTASGKEDRIASIVSGGIGVSLPESVETVNITSWTYKAKVSHGSTQDLVMASAKSLASSCALSGGGVRRSGS